MSPSQMSDSMTASLLQIPPKSSLRTHPLPLSSRIPFLPNGRASHAQTTSAAAYASSKKTKLDLNYRVICQDCQNPVPNLLEDFASGDVICRDCGTILMDRMIDTRSEWRTFSTDLGGASEDPSRVGGPSNPLFADADGDLELESTIISKRDGGTGVSRDLSRLHTKSTMKAGDRSLQQAFKSISVMAERIGLPKLIVDRAKQLYKKVEDERLLRGKTTEGLIAACIYIACRQEKVPRTFREISSLTLVPKKDIGRCYKALAPLLFPHGTVDSPHPSFWNGAQSAVEADKGLLGFASSPTMSPPHDSQTTIKSTITFPQPNGGGNPLGTVSTQDFLARFCSYLNLNVEIQKAAMMLCQRAQDIGCIAGKSPISIAAAGIYMITQLYPQYRKPQKDIAYVAGVSEITIKNTYKELFPWRYDLIPANMAPRALVDALPQS